MMENVLQAVIVVFMLFLCALCLFAVVVIARDIVHESAKARREREREEREDRLSAIERQLALRMSEQKPSVSCTQAEAPAKEVVAPVVTTPVVTAEPTASKEEPAKTETSPEASTVIVKEGVEVEPETLATAVASEVEEVSDNEVAFTDDVIEETADAEQDVAENVEEEEDPDAVSFNRLNLSVEDKYETLSTEFKRYFDDIIRHALSKEGVKEFKRSTSYDYKIGAYKVLRITIKRGEIICSFNFIDRNFNDYANGSTVKIKQSATVVRVFSPSGVGAVKDGIDLVCEQIAEDKERKKEVARAKRRERRRLQKESATVEE